MEYVKLIDFGLSQPYVDKEGKHIKRERAMFSGNFAFCSKHAIKQCAPTRRDDLISLAYLLLYVNAGSLWFFLDDSKEETFEHVLMAKH